MLQRGVGARGEVRRVEARAASRENCLTSLPSRQAVATPTHFDGVTRAAGVVYGRDRAVQDPRVSD